MTIAARAVLPRCYRTAMATRTKRSISLPADLDARIQAEARQDGLSYSAWLAETARKEITLRRGLAAVAEVEEQLGAFTPGELVKARGWAEKAVGGERAVGGEPAAPTHRRRAA